MRLRTLMGAGVALAVLALSGCAPMTKVKDVQTDTQAYMNANFSPEKLAKDVARTINSSDPGPLAFHKMTFEFDWRVNDDDKNKTVAFKQQVSYTNAGGSLVQEKIDNYRNGVPMSADYSISYRGVLSLMSQAMNLNATMAGATYELKGLQHFDAVTRPSAAGQQLDYQYTLGSSAQLMNFPTGRTTCTVGSDYPAAKINPQLAGEAHDLDCVVYNRNGVKVHSTRYAYLNQYGVATVTHTEYAAGISDARLTSFQIN